MKSLTPVWKESVDLWAPVFRRAWSWLVFSTAVDELSSLLADTLRKINESYTPLAIIFTVTVQLLMSGFGVIIINQLIQDVMDKKETHLMKSLEQNLKYVFIESARALLKITVGLLIVIPGLVATVNLYFVPYVAQFDPDYKSGHVDALERSKDLCKGYFWRFSGILILTSILSMVPGFWLGTVEVFVHPYLFVMAFFISMVLELYTDVVLFCTYKTLQSNLMTNPPVHGAGQTKMTQGGNHGTAFSMQGASQPGPGTDV